MKKIINGLIFMATISIGTYAQAQCPAPACSPITVISSPITTNTTFNATQVYRIQGCITVASGVTLTIDPGAVITFDDNDFLIINPGATIDAEGLSDCPIVFTATGAPGMRTAKNAGLIIRGEGIIQSPVALPCSISHTTGSDNTDNSGILKYCTVSLFERFFRSQQSVCSWQCTELNRCG